MSQSAPPSNLLLTLIITLLTPMFLCAGSTDIALARQAAAETVNAYRARDPVSLFTIAKIIAFEFATLSSLSLSMADDVSLSLTLRLRGNANSMDRAAERNRLALEQHRIPAGAAHLTEASVAASVAEAQKLVQQSRASLQAALTPPAAAPAPAAVPPATARPATAAPSSRPPIGEQQRRTAWAQAMADVAAEFTAGLDTLSPAERAKEMMRINILTQSAGALVSAPPAAGLAVLAASR
jgi:hypothetical protein